MSRPKAFDPSTALDRAVGAFSEHGFAGTSTSRLLDAMGITRQSMYDTFQDKRQLYLEALRRHNAETVARLIRALTQEASPRKGLEAMLLEYVLADTVGVARSLDLGSICEFGRDDEAVAQLNDSASRVLRAAVERVAADARDAGEIGGSLAPRTIARYLLTLGVGLKVSARAGATAADLLELVEFGMRRLDVSTGNWRSEGQEASVGD
jgi:AcrR family transcriptional regulator